MPTWRRKRLARNRKKIARDRLGLLIVVDHYRHPFVDSLSYFAVYVTDSKTGKTFETYRSEREKAISDAVAKANEWRRWYKTYRRQMKFYTGARV